MIKERFYKSPEDLYRADLHEEIKGTSFNSWALRVPGGWIYTVKDNSVFVPFDNEFMGKYNMKISYRYDNGKMCGYIAIDENDIIVETMPILKKFIGQKMENLISWTNQNFRYCTIERLK